jgi:hypothetical protein
MATANQKAMDVMFKGMNTIVAGNGRFGLTDKENIPPAGNVNPGNNNGGTKRTKKMPSLQKTHFSTSRRTAMS